MNLINLDYTPIKWLTRSTNGAKSDENYTEVWKIKIDGYSTYCLFYDFANPIKTLEKGDLKTILRNKQFISTFIKIDNAFHTQIRYPKNIDHINGILLNKIIESFISKFSEKITKETEIDVIAYTDSKCIKIEE